MFSRQFMRNFPLRKYANPTSPRGNISSSYWLFGQRDYIPTRITAYLYAALTLTLASTNFDIFGEILTEPSPAYHKDSIDRNVPASIKQSNQEVIALYQQINQMKKILKNFNVNL